VPVAVRREALQQFLLLLGRQLGRATVGRQPPRAHPQHDLRRALAEQACARRAVAAAARSACLRHVSTCVQLRNGSSVTTPDTIFTVSRAPWAAWAMYSPACGSRNADHQDGTCTFSATHPRCVAAVRGQVHPAAQLQNHDRGCLKVCWCACKVGGRRLLLKGRAGTFGRWRFHQCVSRLPKAKQRALLERPDACAAGTTQSSLEYVQTRISSDSI